MKFIYQCPKYNQLVYIVKDQIISENMNRIELTDGLFRSCSYKKYFCKDCPLILKKEN